MSEATDKEERDKSRKEKVDEDEDRKVGTGSLNMKRE